jgi:hypothetical protein
MNEPNKQTKLAIVTMPIFSSFLPILETLFSCSFPSKLLLLVKGKKEREIQLEESATKMLMKMMITKSRTLLYILEEL